MAEIVAVSKEHHSHRTWHRPRDYFAAAKDPVIPLVSQEVPRAMMSMPLAFMESGGTHFLVAVQGFRQGQNKFVSSGGQWLGDYVPAAYRAHPFKLARNQEGAEVLCIDELAGRVSASTSGLPFFLADGTPAPDVAEVLKMLADIEQDRKRTLNSCASLARHALFEPWPVKAHDGDQILEANGLLRISEVKLNALEPGALAEVRNNGGLMLAYAQLFSMQQIHRMTSLGKSSKSTQGGPPTLTDEHGTLSFTNL